MNKEEALQFVRTISGGRQYISVDSPTFDYVMEQCQTISPIEETSSTHWWEDVYDIQGTRYAVGGLHGSTDAKLVQQIVDI